MRIEVGADMQKQFDRQITNISDECLNTWIEDYQERIWQLEDGIEQESENIEGAVSRISILGYHGQGNIEKNLKKWSLELEERKRIEPMLTREAQKRRSTAFQHFTGPHTTAGELQRDPECSLIIDQKEAYWLVNVIYSDKNY